MSADLQKIIDRRKPWWKKADKGQLMNDLRCVFSDAPELWMKHEAFVSYCGGHDKIEKLKAQLKAANGRRKSRIMSWERCADIIRNVIEREFFVAVFTSGYITNKQGKAVHYYQATTLPNTSVLLVARMDDGRIVAECRRGLAYRGKEESSAFPEIRAWPFSPNDAVIFWHSKEASIPFTDSIMAWAEANR